MEQLGTHPEITHTCKQQFELVQLMCWDSISTREQHQGSYIRTADVNAGKVKDSGLTRELPTHIRNHLHSESKVTVGPRLQVFPFLRVTSSHSDGLSC